jgi:membrane-associated phospholipid phosphatase
MSCLVLVGAAILFVDRPASTWSHDHLGRPAIFNRLTQYTDPLTAVAALTLAGAAVRSVFFGWKSGECGRTLISACLAVLVAEEIKDQLKYFFGRPWPEAWTSDNPSWIANHAYGFQLFHGGSGWESFPSGHTAQMSALAAVIWLRLPRIRWLGVAMTVIVAFALWASNYHFVGDIIAGAFLGAACGIGMVAVVCRE